jgi:hypothetical protein
MRKVGIAAAVAVAAVPLAVLAYLHFFSSDPGVERIVIAAGFYPITPPSTLVEPGSIYQVSEDGRFYTRICRAAEEDTRPVTIPSAAEQWVVNRLRSGNFELSGEAAQEINARLNGNIVETIQLSFRDVSYMEIPVAENERIFVKLTDDKACHDAVEKLLGWGDLVCQGQAVLRATTEYRLVTQGGTNGGAEISDAELLDALKGVISTGVTIDEGSVITGVALHYGVRVNPTCVTLPNGEPRRLPPLRIAAALL